MTDRIVLLTILKMSDTPDTPEQALTDAKKAVKGGHALARLLGLTPSAVTQWKVVPDRRVLAVEAATKVSRHRLRPDLYPLEQANSDKAA